MQIQINSDYMVTSDKYNFILNERYKKKKGEGFSYKIISYHGTLESVLNAFVTLNIKSSNAENFKQLFSEIEQMKIDIGNLGVSEHAIL